MNINESEIWEIQRMLFHHPLYQYAQKGSINVVILGANEMTSAFVDLCLQTGQMLDHKLDIQWFSRMPEETKTKYLATRPALGEFINIDGELDGQTIEIYGKLDFVSVDQYFGITESTNYYVFDSENDSWKDEKNSITENELEQMAFNVHRIWEGPGNVNLEKCRERFHKPYNHEASVNFVLSLPYKLSSVGLSGEISENTAQEFAKKINEIDEKKGKSNSIIARLAALEHRRWVLEKLCSGWIPYNVAGEVRTYSSCANRGSIKYIDKEHGVKMHPCIVRSTSATPLSTGVYSDEKSFWDKESEHDKELDPLDLMSVQLHREMLRAAEDVRRNRKLLEDELDSLKAQTANGENVVQRNYNRYVLCVKNILDRSERYSSQYESYEKDLLESLNVQGYSETVKGHISTIHEMLFPVIESNEYRDYKKYDEDLIRQIPFILSGKDHLSLGLTMASINGDSNTNQVTFQEVASSTALSAENLFYLYYFDKNTDLSLIYSKISGVKDYFTYRSHQRKLHFFTILNDTPERKKAIKKIFSRLQTEGVVEDYIFEEFSDYPSVISKAIDYMKDKVDLFTAPEALFDSGYYDGKLIAAASEVIPYFEFDSKCRQFTNEIGASYLRYIPITNFIQVEDMFALMNAHDRQFNYEDYADTYLDFWSVYSGETVNLDFSLAVSCWTRLCQIVMEKDGNRTPIDKTNPRRRDAILSMLNALRKKGIISYTLSGENHNQKVETITCNQKNRQMFAKSGNILEVYTYFEACKQEWFDDIQTGYQFEWEKDNVINELDCVLTKGYQSIILECKSVASPSEQYYLTLDSLANRYGINCKKVLVMVTDTKNLNYENYVSRGNQMGIVTYSTQSDIENIGERLKDLLMANDF